MKQTHSNISLSLQAQLLISSIFMSMLWLTKGNLYPSMEWNPLNPIFKTSKSIVQFNVTMKSHMNIICPNVATNPIYLENAIDKDFLYENLWFVDKEGFESCQANATRKNNLLLYQCSNPIGLKYRRLTFQAVSPVKGEPEFQEGQEYYFIATSNGSKVSMENEKHGHCKTHNMRFKIYVCIDKNDKRCKLHLQDSEVLKTTSSTPTNIEDMKMDTENTPLGRSTKGCFLSSKDKIWLIAIGVVVGIVLMLLVACLVFTWKRRRLPYDYQDGKIPLNDKEQNNAV